MSTTNSPKAAFSIPSIIAIVAAIFSFKMGAFFGLVLAGVAIVAGLIGILLSLSPTTRGGMFSIFGIIGGAIGVIAAIIKAIMWMTGG
ncbi:MAG: hypothetical protein ABIS50_15655 [Luteolibacter sp.]|uniref:hypothetical protein n=1 Tax=Luteolibacter sp. TaxID=1962973 RepID=UPI0032634C27